MISIDGQKILGYSAEKARHLLQQARARGWVQLIVTSRGGEGGAGGERAGGSLKSNIPESVVLRQKKKNKESELKKLKILSLFFTHHQLVCAVVPSLFFLDDVNIFIATVLHNPQNLNKFDIFFSFLSRRLPKVIKKTSCEC